MRKGSRHRQSGILVFATAVRGVWTPPSSLAHTFSTPRPWFLATGPKLRICWKVSSLMKFSAELSDPVSFLYKLKAGLSIFGTRKQASGAVSCHWQPQVVLRAASSDTTQVPIREACLMLSIEAATIFKFVPVWITGEHIAATSSAI